MTNKTKEEELLAQKWKDEEYLDAIKYADRFLDESYADPDDEIRTISRQFNRSIERLDDAISVISSFASHQLEIEKALMKKFDELEFTDPDKSTERWRNYKFIRNNIRDTLSILKGEENK